MRVLDKPIFGLLVDINAPRWIRWIPVTSTQTQRGHFRCCSRWVSGVWVFGRSYQPLLKGKNLFIAHLKVVGEWVIAVGQRRRKVIDSSAFLAVKIIDDDVDVFRVSSAVDFPSGETKDTSPSMHIVMHFLSTRATFEKWNYVKHSDEFPSESILI